MALVPFDDRDGVIWWNGEFRPWRDSKLHVLSHGLHYASAVFEGERCYAGEIFKLREHTERLLQSGRILGFEIPYTAQQIDDACNETIRRNGLTNAYVRPIAWRGAEEMGVAAKATTVQVAIAVWEWGAYFGVEQRMKGVNLAMAKWRRPHPETAPTASKAAGLYMIGTMSKEAAMDEGADDAMMLDWKGDLAEATGANAFFVMDGEVHTPKPTCFLDGITRRTVMDLARKRQMKVVERVIHPDELPKASEVFLAGTAAEVTPVRRIGAHDFTPGAITETLMKDYDALVNRRG
ncbi:branched-chain amino acid aminotransferase [Roseococcus sp. SDR]|uniref:branched-chain amino acid aminotransferase n=1 Tax=Roseococcus sp. SDR TaxID=2835532 RepID=UPI001BCFF3A7|nr:branched-chain amino acid aminotransferase [Roseococcus sp. SDR]MBS7789115.1 branched-chain amino acid aminotransferase [Roseococcus sp. SDR]MBV1844429.1 branched-chain amino acid aminotransferase [Roseococcus sp. SDR]